MDTLEDVARRVKDCTDCPLHLGRTNAVPGEGPPDAELLFIGEGPGFQEDRQGRPFVGPAGGFLEQLLQSIGMTRDQVYIANMVKCRPPDNRDPSLGEIAACSKYLDRQIQLIDPRLIVTLGRFATSRFIPGQSISSVRGRLRTVNGQQIFPIMHPPPGCVVRKCGRSSRKTSRSWLVYWMSCAWKPTRPPLHTVSESHRPTTNRKPNHPGKISRSGTCQRRTLLTLRSNLWSCHHLTNLPQANNPQANNDYSDRSTRG